MRKLFIILLSFIFVSGIIFGGVLILKKAQPQSYDKIKNIFVDTKDYLEEFFDKTDNNTDNTNEESSNKYTIYVGGELSSDISSNSAIITIIGVDITLEKGMVFVFDNLEYVVGDYSVTEEQFEILVPMDKGIYLYQGENILVNFK